MNSTFKLSVLGVLASAQVDCSGYAPWTTSTSGNPPTSAGWKVYKDNKAYEASTWVESTQVPGGSTDGSWSPWTLVGDCQANTMGDGTAGLPEVDCSAYIPYDSTVKGSPAAGKKWMVHKDGLGYTADTWVDETTVPGVVTTYTPWTLQGRCKAGTAGNGSNAPGTLDCSSIYEWSPYLTYATEGTMVHHEGSAYKTKYWNEGTKPSRSAEPWEYVEKCIAGTDTLGPESDVNMPAQWKLDLTCNCCAKCGTILNGQVVCKDVDADQCFYKWCGDSNSMNEATCQDLKDKQTFAAWDGTMPPSQPSWPKQVYAPYFDSGLYGWPPLTELATKYNVKHFIVAFIVSTSLPQLQNGGCQGAFAGAISTESGPTYEKDGKFSYLYDELKKLRELGGDFVISFGGANGIELADSTECQTGDAVANLKAEYGRILDLTNSNRIDFDIEGNAYSSVQASTGWKFRFEAVKALKAERPDLHVTWTLPILPTGLTDDGVLFFGQMMQQDAPFDIINVMNMDYGECPTMCETSKVDACERDAVDNLVQQLFSLATENGKASEYGWTSPDSVYPFVGSTPMLGMNDITCLTYTLEAAKTNVEHWKQKKIGILSNWSIARDHPCPGQAYVGVDCSSYAGQTQDFEFLQVFAPFTSN